jgi:hypothetical protein
MRVRASSGQPAGFGQLPLDVCPGGTAQDLTQVMVDCRSRIIATGPCPKDGLAHIATVRTSIDGVVDTQFGAGGLVQGNPRGAKLAPDERIYVVGDSDTTAAIWRFWPNGHDAHRGLARRPYGEDRDLGRGRRERARIPQAEIRSVKVALGFFNEAHDHPG